MILRAKRMPVSKSYRASQPARFSPATSRGRSFGFGADRFGADFAGRLASSSDTLLRSADLRRSRMGASGETRLRGVCPISPPHGLLTDEDRGLAEPRPRQTQTSPTTRREHELAGRDAAPGEKEIAL